MKLTDNIEERFCPNVSFSTENLKKPAFYKMIIFQACFVDMTSNIWNQDTQLGFKIAEYYFFKTSLV